MIEKTEIVRLFDYSEWANLRILSAVETVPAEEFTRDLGGSHGGIRGTLWHTLGAEVIWLARFEGNSSLAPPKEDEFTDVAAFRAGWAAFEERRSRWLAQLPEDAATRVLHYRNLKGEPFSAPLWPLVQHLTNHGSYHRGQVVAFLRQLGHKPPTTDMVAFDRERAPKG